MRFARRFRLKRGAPTPLQNAGFARPRLILGDVRRITAHRSCSYFCWTYPVIDPVLLHLGPLAIRWYALAYIAGLIAGWALIRRVAVRTSGSGAAMARPSPGVHRRPHGLLRSGGGRSAGGWGRCWFTTPAIISPIASGNPDAVAWRHGLPWRHVGGAGRGLVVSRAVTKRSLAQRARSGFAWPRPSGSFFGRIANFIKPELWGRPTDVPWAMVFPGSDGQPRHPEPALRGWA